MVRLSWASINSDPMVCWSYPYQCCLTMHFDLSWRANHFDPMLHVNTIQHSLSLSLLPSQDATFSCSFFSIMSCKRSRDCSHCSHLLHALMAALKETTSAWTPKCQHSFRIIKACCHFSHFSQAVIAEFTAIRLFLTQWGLTREFQFVWIWWVSSLSHVDSMLIHVAPLALNHIH